MIIFPAIDIRNGKCVRLTQGRFDQEDIFSDNPVQTALEWENKGAKYLHLVDLDGALHGKSMNEHVIRKIIASVKIPVQLGGGIRDLEAIKWALDMGIARVIIGTSALREKGFVEKALNSFNNRIVVSVDARNGFVAVNGWTQVSEIKALDFAKQLEEIGLKTLVYTDIHKDGMLGGPNFKELEELSKYVNIDIIASGGVSNKEHVIKLEEIGLYGTIIGKALYTGFIRLEDL